VVDEVSIATPWKKPLFTVKSSPYFRPPTPVLGVKVKRGESVIRLYLKINLSTTISMKISRRDLSIDMVIRMGIFNPLPPSDAVWKQKHLF